MIFTWPTIVGFVVIAFTLLATYVVGYVVGFRSAAIMRGARGRTASGEPEGTNP